MCALPRGFLRGHVSIDVLNYLVGPLVARSVHKLVVVLSAETVGHGPALAWILL